MRTGVASAMTAAIRRHNDVRAARSFPGVAGVACKLRLSSQASGPGRQAEDAARSFACVARRTRLGGGNATIGGLGQPIREGIWGRSRGRLRFEFRLCFRKPPANVCLDNGKLRVYLHQRVHEHRGSGEPREPLPISWDHIPRRPGGAACARASLRTPLGSRPNAPSPARRWSRTSSCARAGRSASGNGCAAPPWTS